MFFRHILRCGGGFFRCLGICGIFCSGICSVLRIFCNYAVFGFRFRSIAVNIKHSFKSHALIIFCHTRCFGRLHNGFFRSKIRRSKFKSHSLRKYRNAYTDKDNSSGYSGSFFVFCKRENFCFFLFRKFKNRLSIGNFRNFNFSVKSFELFFKFVLKTVIFVFSHCSHLPAFLLILRKYGAVWNLPCPVVCQSFSQFLCLYIHRAQ